LKLDSQAYLDRVEQSLAPGDGLLDLGLGIDLIGAGGYLVYDHRFNDGMSAFAMGEVGVLWGGMDPYARALAGFRVRF